MGGKLDFHGRREVQKALDTVFPLENNPGQKKS
jgi:hypothetical protein